MEEPSTYVVLSKNVCVCILSFSPIYFCLELTEFPALIRGKQASREAEVEAIVVKLELHPLVKS